MNNEELWNKIKPWLIGINIGVYLTVGILLAK